ncbi:2-aminoethylphosphonate--pyruvate transaminase [Apibacter muscae]|uniref:2-aminoethylphosphonate--pyruvate transaminase n=1 Tax=Apibacter muscae TaxID=2509004 RepID=UPI001C8745AB|nr:2-aminoethylphosphonate--pyruvate transaminase [Apibacter muscae]
MNPPIGSVLRPQDKLLIVANGAYGKRMAEIATYYKINHLLVSLNETEIIDPIQVKNLLNENKDITHFSMVHCETTTGILNPLKEISDVVKNYPVTFIVDAMSSFGGIPIDIKDLGIDFLISSSNKCIQGVLRFGFVIALKDKLKECKGIARSLSLDLYDQWITMEEGNGKWRFTSPTHVVIAFFQALKELEEEGGIESRYLRYKENNKLLIEGMKSLGFKPLLPMNVQSPIITSFLYPFSNFSFIDFYNQLKSKGYVIYPGKISMADTFRMGNIGNIYPKDIENLIESIKNS